MAEASTPVVASSTAVIDATRAAIQLATASGHSLDAVVDAMRSATITEHERAVVDRARTWRWTGSPESARHLCAAIDALHAAEHA